MDLTLVLPAGSPEYCPTWPSIDIARTSGFVWPKTGGSVVNKRGMLCGTGSVKQPTASEMLGKLGPMASFVQNRSAPQRYCHSLRHQHRSSH